MATIKTKPIYRFYEFASPFRMERREDGSEVLVQPGYAFVNETVPGDRYSLKRSAMQAATDGYREWEALREMHQPLAAGFVPKLEWDERGAYIEAHVVDPIAQQKVRTGTYKGFSVGVTPTLVNRANEVESCDWIEISLVDRPKDPQATFTVARVEGVDPDAEVEVEVIDDASPAVAAAAPDSAIAASIPSSPNPSGGASPSAALQSAQAPAEGVSSLTETERALLLGAGLTEGMLASVDAEARARVREVMVAMAQPTTEDAGDARAMTSDEVPVRENLDAKPKMYADCRGDRDAAGLAYSIDDAHYALMDSLYSILSSGEADKQGLMRESVGQYTAHLQEMCKAKAERGEMALTLEVVASRHAHAAMRRILAAEERADKPEGEYGDVNYADPGLQDDKKPRYPLDTKEHVTAAWSYINQEDNASKYSSADLAKVRAKIMAAAKKAGIEISDEAKQRAAVVEDTPAAPETVSRTDVRDDPSELQRLQTANSELSQRLAAQEEALTRLAASEAEVKRLGALPKEQERPPVRYAHALDRRFLANLGNEGEAAIAVLRADYEAAKQEAAAERNGDRTKLNRATERMILRASQLAEHGILV